MDNRKNIEGIRDEVIKSAQNGDPLARILLLGEDNVPLYFNKATGEISEKEN